MMKPVYKIETKEFNGQKYLIGYHLAGETDETRPALTEDLFFGDLPRELFDEYFQPLYCFDDLGAIIKNPLPAPEKALLEKELKSLNLYLNATDWYIVRFIERGVAVPKEVSENRSRAINRINEIKASLEKLNN